MNALSDQSLLTVSDAAATLGVTARTLKYYEELRLIEPVRSEGGYRLYSAADIDKFQRILRMRSLGFSLAAITEMLRQPLTMVAPGKHRLSDEQLAEVRTALQTQLATLQSRVRQVRQELREAENLEASLKRDLDYIEQRLGGASADELLAQRRALHAAPPAGHAR